jgi:hypothetical protein
VSTAPGYGQANQMTTQGRNADVDRQYAYAPAARANGAVEVWRPPTFGEILKELGWRMLEASIQAAGAEIAYFFSKRRFGIPTYVNQG